MDERRLIFRVLKLKLLNTSNEFNSFYFLVVAIRMIR